MKVSQPSPRGCRPRAAQRVSRETLKGRFPEPGREDTSSRGCREAGTQRPIPNEEPGRTLVPLGRERGGGAEPGGGEGGQPGFAAAGRRPHPSGGGRVAPGWAAEPGAGGGRSSDLGDQQRDDDGLGCCSEDGERLHSGGPRSAPRAAGGAAEDARAGPGGARRARHREALACGRAAAGPARRPPREAEAALGEASGPALGGPLPSRSFRGNLLSTSF